MYQTVHASSKILIGLLLDLSGTLNYNNNIEKLNDGIEALYEQILKNTNVEFVELCVMTFGGRDGVKLVQPFSNPQLHTNTYFEAYGLSPLAQAMTAMLQELKNTTIHHLKNRQTFHDPILITLTDGIPTTDQYDQYGQPTLLTKHCAEFIEAKKRFTGLHADIKSMQSYVIHFGDDLEDPFFLRAFASTRQHVVSIESFQIVPILQKFGQTLGELPLQSSNTIKELDPFSEISKLITQFGRPQKGGYR